jgi:hypothetical protein
MKEIRCLLFLVFAFTSLQAQKEFWSYRDFDYLNGIRKGAIVKTDFGGEHAVVMHVFDSTHGSYPQGSLLQASNGKLYGVTAAGGYAIPNSSRHTGFGMLFEYDLETDRYRVLTSFGADLTTVAGPSSSLIEPSPGILFGTADRTIFKHNIANNTTSLVATFPNFQSQLLTIQNTMRGSLMKASNGNLYGTALNYSACPGGMPLLGSITRVNPTTGALTLTYPFDCVGGPPKAGNGQLIEVGNGKLYGTTYVGGNNVGPNGVAPAGSGTLFEYDIALNKMTVKFHFDYATTGSNPGPLTLGPNNKLYGVLGSNGKDPANPSKDVEGSLFEYDITTGVVTVLHYFEYTNLISDLGYSPGGSLTKGSDGYYYGLTTYCIFKFDPTTGAVTRASSSNRPFDHDILEICRKPAYRFFETDQFTICTGSPFVFDLHNTNATTYVWKRNGQVVANHTTGVLKFDNLALTDAGTYTCEMENECGKTITKSLQLIVNPATTSTVFPSIPAVEDVVQICPGSSLTLSGNNASGKWSTGQTTPTITVTEPGTYQIINTNNCGNTYSNIVKVEIREIPDAITIGYDTNSPICNGASITLTGNVAGGMWQDGSTAGTYAVTVDTKAGTDYYVTLEHTCGNIQSNVIRFKNENLWDDPLPEILPEGSLSFCAGTEVNLWLNSNKPIAARNVWMWLKTEPILNYISNDPSILITEPGTYMLRRTSYCFGEIESTVTVSMANEPPPEPVITVIGDLPMCPGTGVTLQADVTEEILWTTGETTSSINVYTEGAYGLSATNGCGTTTSWIGVPAHPVPSAAVTTDNDVLIANEAGAASYQWYDCAFTPARAIDHAVGQSYTATKSGSYAVKLVNTFGCEAVSDCQMIQVDPEEPVDPEDPTEPEEPVDPGDPVLAAEPSLQNSIKLRPNPAKEYIELRTEIDIKEIIVINALGQTVVRVGRKKEINISQLPKGYYMVIVNTGMGSWRSKFIKE